MEDLNNNSKELITIQLYHKPLNLSAEQAKNLIVSLSKTVNENLILRSSREDISITIIETNNIKKDFLDNSDQIARLSNIINSSQKNISEMKTNYSSLLQNYDLENLFTLANITQKNLYEISKQLGSTYAIDNINVNIRQKERDINDLISSLELLDRQKIETFSSSNQNSNTSEVSGSVTQLDAEVFDKILSIGSLLNLNSFRLNTVEKIQQLQKEKSNLLNQKELLNLPYNTKGKNYDLDEVSEKIIILAKEVNKVNSQILDMTEPKSAFEIIKNPELIKLNSKPISKYARKLNEHDVTECAISSYDGEIEFYLSRETNQQWTKGISHAVTQQGEKILERNTHLIEKKISVPCYTLQTFLSMKEITHIDYLKLDTEGHEMDIFEAYDWRVLPTFIKLEHHHIDDLRMKKMLEERGYMVYTEGRDIYAVR